MEYKADKKDVLQVRTLGEFALVWNGKIIGGGSKAVDSQFTRLMQMILHFKDKGVDRMQMQNLLFGDSNSEDVHHLLRTVIYNTRKKLRQAGLPDANYIEFRDGRYYWTDEIEVFEDAAYFSALCEDAAKEAGREMRGIKLLKAAYYYSGEFLPQQTMLSWVTNESQSYIAMFDACVTGGASYLVEKGDYQELEKLGRHAMAKCRLHDWEVITIDALVNMGRIREARELYEATVENYQRELGVTASKEFIKHMEVLISRSEHPVMLLEGIQAQMEEEDAKGGYLCSFPTFKGIYRMMQRTFGRSGESAFVMLCTVVGIDGGDKVTGSELSELSDKVRNVICHSVRRSDVVCRYGKGQFLLLLINRTIDNCDIVRDRIEKNLRTAKLSVVMDYQIKPLKMVGGEGVFERHGDRRHP